ncbi:Phosphoglycerate dehydrogenase [Planctomycetales bacterium 10988]|nr:Phosphoglycerate dehydrogenase [Planctomycetales bacterium 10988]
MFSPRIVLCYPVQESHLQQIAAAAPEAKVVNAGQEHIAEELLAADIYCGHAKVPVPWKEVVEQGRLQWIQSSAAGCDHCLVPEVIASDIPVTSASGVLADQVSEHTVALIFSWLRSLPVFFEAQKKKEFIRRPTKDIHHLTIGIVGLGGVGRRIAEVLSVYKTKIMAVDLFPVNKPDHVEKLWHVDRLPEMLPEVDILILSAPLNQQSRGMIRAEHFALMKPSALFVNVARGPLVVERDLVKALKAKKIAGAVMDVTEVEPLAENSELWEMPNVIITPHVGGQSARRIDDMTDFFCENLKRWQRGEPLKNLVEKTLGFPIPQEKSATTVSEPSS